jgi:hypothetical protein
VTAERIYRPFVIACVLAVLAVVQGQEQNNLETLEDADGSLTRLLDAAEGCTTNQCLAAVSEELELLDTMRNAILAAETAPISAPPDLKAAPSIAVKLPSKPLSQITPKPIVEGVPHHTKRPIKVVITDELDGDGDGDDDDDEDDDDDDAAHTLPPGKPKRREAGRQSEPLAKLRKFETRYSTRGT